MKFETNITKQGTSLYILIPKILLGKIKIPNGERIEIEINEKGMLQFMLNLNKFKSQLKEDFNVIRKKN